MAGLTDTRSKRLVLALLVLATLALLTVAQADARRAAKHGPRASVSKVNMRTSVKHSGSSRTALSVVPRSPANGATLSGRIAWQVSAAGGQVTRVEFAVDGSVRFTDSSAPFAYGGGGLDTTKLADGAHQLTATAYAKGTKASATIKVNVLNHPAPPAVTPPAAEPAPTPQPTSSHHHSRSPETTPTPAPEPEPMPEPEPTPPFTPEPEPETSPAPEPEAETAPEAPANPVPSSSKILWGAWIGEQLTGTQAPWDMGAVSKFEQLTGKGLSIVNFSAPFANCSGSKCSFYNFPTGEFNAIRQHGAIPFYSWGSQSIPVPSNLSEPNFQLSDVIAGTYDSYIRKFAEAAKAWGHPFFLRFNWEMNGEWFAWAEGVNGNKPGEYVAAWRHVHDIFTEVGATNATWVWCPNVDPEHQMRSLAASYPGDKYVDWTGLDGYNWGTNPARPDRWRTFDQLYRSTYREITETIAPSKPLIVSEVGSTEDGGSKATWIKEMLEEIPTSYPQIRGLVWFDNYADGMDWPIETSTSATKAFATGIQNSAYVGNQFATTASGPVLAPS